MIETVTYETYRHALMIAWATVVVFFPLFFAFIKESKAPWGRFWIVWATTTILSGIILILLLSSPDKVQSLWDKVFNSTKPSQIGLLLIK